MAQRKTKSTKPSVDKQTTLPARKTFPVSFTKMELVHLRDLFNVALPPALQTISQALAAAEQRHHIETKLWNKISRACASAEVPLDDEAPDFVTAVSAPPSIGVFRMELDESEQHEGAEQPDFSAVFSDVDPDGEESE